MVKKCIEDFIPPINVLPQTIRGDTPNTGLGSGH